MMHDQLITARPLSKQDHFDARVSAVYGHWRVRVVASASACSFAIRSIESTIMEDGA